MNDFVGYEGVCDDEQSIVLGDAECIQMLNLVFDQDGNTAQLAYRRSGSDEIESVGYGEGDYNSKTAIDFGESGCLTGYELGFADVSSGRLLSGETAELRYMNAVSNPKLLKSLKAYSYALEWDIIEPSDVIVFAEDEDDCECPGGGKGRRDLFWVFKVPAKD